MKQSMIGSQVFCISSRSLLPPRTPGARGKCSNRPSRLAVRAAATKEPGVLDAVKKAFGKAEEEETRFRWNPAQSRYLHFDPL